MIGAAAASQFLDYAEIEELARLLDAPTQRLNALANPAHRVLLVRDRVGDFMLDHDLHGLPGIPPPGHCRAEKLGAERPNMERHAEHRDTGREKAPGELVENRDARSAVVDRRAQLLRNALDRCPRRALVRRTFDRLDDDNGVNWLADVAGGAHLRVG